jgi:hypothetical protein
MRSTAQQNTAIRKVAFLLAVLGSMAPGRAVADELVSSDGDRLSGRIVSLDGRAVVFRHASGSEVSVPLDRLRSLVSRDALAVSLRNGDRVVGSLALGADRTLRVRSSLVGEVALPLDTVAAVGPLASPSPKVTAARALTATEAAAVAGSGGGPGRAMVLAQAPAGAPGDTAPGNAGPGDTTAPGNATSPRDATQEADLRTQLRFLRGETVLLERRDVETDVVASYLRNDNSSASDRVFSLTPTLRVGLLSGLEAFVSVPFIMGERDVQLLDTISTPRRGVGDTRFGLKYRLVKEDASWPGIFVGVSASAPTGDAPYLDVPDLGDTPPPVDIRDPFAPSLGGGHWIVTGSLAFLRTYDPVVLFAGFDYSRTLPETYFGRSIQPGDRYGINLGLGFTISEFSTLGIQMLGGWERPWSFNGTDASHSSAWPLSTRISYTHRMSPRDFLEPSIVFGLTDDSTDAVFSLAYTHRF